MYHVTQNRQRAASVLPYSVLAGSTHGSSAVAYLALSRRLRAFASPDKKEFQNNIFQTQNFEYEIDFRVRPANSL